MRRIASLTGIVLTIGSLLAVAVGAYAQGHEHAGGSGSPALAAQQAGPTLSLIAGQGEGVIGMEGFIADPALGGTTARVAEGTTVIWTSQASEIHTVTFLAGRPRPAPFIPQPEDPAGRPPMFNPDFFFPAPAPTPWDGTGFVTSGALDHGQQFAVTFGKAGKFDYVCAVHEPMTGSIEVAAAGSPGITTQAAVDQLAASHMAAVHDRQIAKIFAEKNTATWVEGPDGSTTWSIRAGTEWRYGHLNIYAFLPDNLAISQGDTVSWFVDHPIPHTVTFSDPGAPPPDFQLIQLPDGTLVAPSELGPAPPPDPHHPGGPPPDPSTLPRLVLGPGGLQSKASPTHNGTGLYNSGVIGELGNESFGLSKTWSLRFDEPGSYDYVCLLHEPLGMTGQITVEPRG